MLSHICSLLLCASSVLADSLPERGVEARAPQNTNPGRRINFQKRNLDTITKIYNTTVYPNNVAFAQRGPASVPPGLFNENAIGRISPLGNFTGFNDSTEYFFALAPIPRAPNYIGFSKIQITAFQSSCAKYASSIVYFTGSIINPNATNNGQFVNSLKQVAFWEFDDDGAVLKYDAFIPNLGLYTALSVPPNVPTEQVQAANIQQLCGAVQSECTGSNTQYNSTQDCITTLSAKKYGNWDEVWMDSVVCRNLHVLLARIDPVAHCPHVGPTGGGKCIDEPYIEGYFLSDEALFGRPAGQNFICPASLAAQDPAAYVDDGL